MKKRTLAIMVAVLLLLVVASTASAHSGCRAWHRVRRGENLYRISLRYGTTVNCMMRANPRIWNRNIIYAGQRLCVPAHCGGGGGGGGAGVWYRVRRGDTLSGISWRFHANMWCIVRANSRIHNPNRIYTGQRIFIPNRCRY